eukprot:754200-Hanusia_phi.AAC.8
MAASWCMAITSWPIRNSVSVVQPRSARMISSAPTALPLFPCRSSLSSDRDSVRLARKEARPCSLMRFQETSSSVRLSLLLKLEESAVAPASPTSLKETSRCRMVDELATTAATCASPWSPSSFLARSSHVSARGYRRIPSVTCSRRSVAQRLRALAHHMAPRLRRLEVADPELPQRLHVGRLERAGPQLERRQHSVLVAQDLCQGPAALVADGVAAQVKDGDGWFSQLNGLGDRGSPAGGDAVSAEVQLCQLQQREGATESRRPLVADRVVRQVELRQVQVPPQPCAERLHRARRQTSGTSLVAARVLAGAGRAEVQASQRGVACLEGLEERALPGGPDAAALEEEGRESSVAAEEVGEDSAPLVSDLVVAEVQLAELAQAAAQPGQQKLQGVGREPEVSQGERFLRAAPGDLDEKSLHRLLLPGSVPVLSLPLVDLHKGCRVDSREMLCTGLEGLEGGTPRRLDRPLPCQLVYEQRILRVGSSAASFSDGKRQQPPLGASEVEGQVLEVFPHPPPAALLRRFLGLRPQPLQHGLMPLIALAQLERAFARDRGSLSRKELGPVLGP